MNHICIPSKSLLSTDVLCSSDLCAARANWFMQNLCWRQSWLYCSLSITAAGYTFSLKTQMANRSDSWYVIIYKRISFVPILQIWGIVSCSLNSQASQFYGKIKYILKIQWHKLFQHLLLILSPESQETEMNVSAGVLSGLVKQDFSPACWLTSIHPGSVSMSFVQRQSLVMLWKEGGVTSWHFGNNPAMKVQRLSQGQGDMVLSYMHIFVCLFCQAKFKQWLPSVLCRRKPTALITSRKQLRIISLEIKFLPDLSPSLEQMDLHPSQNPGSPAAYPWLLDMSKNTLGARKICVFIQVP